MKAVIMAGGEGTRLRPLTCDIPKPLTRLCGRPVLEYILERLALAGVDNAAVTLRYLPQAIRDHFPDSEYAGIRLNFVEEEEPLGTAGGVKNAAGKLSDDIIVLSGDGICDFDLAAAYRFHKEKGAAATIVMTHVADPREYGLVLTEPSGRIRGFVEKPGWAQSVTDAVNTGIYILSPLAVSMVPDGRKCDFAKDIFPAMLAKEMPVYGYDADGYWCDIGDIGAYVSCQFDMLDGKVDCRLPGYKQGALFFKNTLPVGNYTLMPPVYIGENVKIGNYAQIGPYAVIDDGCTVGAGTTVKNSILLQDVYAGERCELRGTLLCSGASMKKRAGMFEGSVAGSGSIIGRDAAVSPGVKIWPGKIVEDGARAAVNIQYGTAHKGIFDDDGISGEVGIDLTPEICAKIGAAAGETSGGRIGVGDDGSAAGIILKNAVTAGIVSTGAQVFDFGSSFETLFAFADSFCKLDMGIFSRTGGSRAVLKLSGEGGLTLGRARERKIDAAVTNGNIRRCEPSQYSLPYSMSGVKAVYAGELLKLAPDGLTGIGAQVKSPNKEIQRLLNGLLKKLGCGEGKMKIHISASGTDLSFFDEDNQYIDAPRALAIGCLLSFESGEDVALPFDAPRVIDHIAEQYSRQVIRYLSCPADGSDGQARNLAVRQPWVRDGLQNAIRILHYLKQNDLRLSDLARRLPPFAVSVKAVPLKGNPGRLLRSLSSERKTQGQAPGEGVLLATGGGKILLSPLKRGTGMRIMAEAADMEAADDLCADIEKRLRMNETLDIEPNKDYY